MITNTIDRPIVGNTWAETRAVALVQFNIWVLGKFYFAINEELPARNNGNRLLYTNLLSAVVFTGPTLKTGRQVGTESGDPRVENLAA